jgi:hypothetical protein
MQLPANVLTLLNWTLAPDPLTFKAVLAELSNLELELCMSSFTGPSTVAAGRIAWAEYGRRRGFIDFEVRAVSLNGKVSVTFEGEGKPIHSLPLVRPD